jgi:hypothetical protein
MGTWGYGAFANDRALDFFSNVFNEKINDEIESSIMQGVHSGDINEVRAAAAMTLQLIALGVNMKKAYEILNGSLKALNMYRSELKEMHLEEYQELMDILALESRIIKRGIKEL